MLKTQKKVLREAEQIITKTDNQSDLLSRIRAVQKLESKNYNNKENSEDN